MGRTSEGHCLGGASQKTEKVGILHSKQHTVLNTSARLKFHLFEAGGVGEEGYGLGGTAPTPCRAHLGVDSRKLDRKLLNRHLSEAFKSCFKARGVGFEDLLYQIDSFYPWF